MIDENRQGMTQVNLNTDIVRDIHFPLAPRNQLARVVQEIEKQISRLDAATTALKRVQANLKRYRASVLKAACEGRLVPAEAELARKEGRDYEPASELLKRILRERRARWESDTLAKMIAAGKPPKTTEYRVMPPLHTTKSRHTDRVPETASSRRRRQQAKQNSFGKETVPGRFRGTNRQRKEHGVRDSASFHNSSEPPCIRAN
jgi:hypothetical protein